MYIKSFTFNPFQENTYLLYDDTKQAVIVDPGCYNRAEQAEIVEFLDSNELKLVKLINTHAHIDHVFGNKFILDQFGLKPYMHENEIPILAAAERSAEVYGLDYNHSSEVEGFIQEGDFIEFGDTKLSILFVPGHSPGHLVFVNDKKNVMIGGDVLFRGSIGRTDLPGGNHETLLKMIREKVFVLDANMKVYSGHGDPTTVGFEKENNPFF